MKSLPFTREIWKRKLKVLQSGGEAQTRRLEPGLREINEEPDRWFFAFSSPLNGTFTFSYLDIDRRALDVKPRLHEGEIAYVPEAWRITDVDPREADYFPTQIEYRDGLKLWVKRPLNIPKIIPDHWRSARFMPAWAARWFVQFGPPVPQRVQEITFEDCLAEGIVGSEQWLEMSEGDNYKPPEPLHPEDLSNEEIEREISRGWEAYTRQAYSRMWDAAYPKHPFESNPWEMTYRFRLVPRPEGL